MPLPTSTLFPYTTLFRSQGHSLAVRIDDPHGGVSVRLGECARWDLHTGRRGQLDAASDSRSQLHTVRRIDDRSEEHTSELQSRQYLVCRLLLEKKKTLLI